MHVDDLSGLGLFAGLSAEQLADLVEGGSEVRIEPGVDMFREGEHADHWWVLVDGALDLVRRVGREEIVVAKMDQPGQWSGGFRAWDAEGVYLATGRGLTDGRLLQVPADLLRQWTTSWFPFGGHLIAGLYHTARSIESTARQRSALVTLGTLAAGLAHEINNPASAATRAVAALEDACATLLSSVGRLAGNEISAAQFAALDELRREVRPIEAAADPVAQADREQAIALWLDGHGVADGWSIAGPLAAAGIDLDWCARAASLLPGPTLEPALEWLASTYSAGALLSELGESTRRISELVGAVRSYSQMDRGSAQRIDVTEGLESTLVMLGHKLRGGIVVVREFAADVPQIEAYPGELNQVWTNLVDNAVDAMEGAGTLRLATSLDDRDVVVEVGDTGPGLPPDVAARALEAFFTTKDVGKGTGLGLDIARRIIVERHGGTITIDSRPGETVFRVRLPVGASRP